MNATAMSSKPDIRRRSKPLPTKSELADCVREIVPGEVWKVESRSHPGLWHTARLQAAFDGCDLETDCPTVVACNCMANRRCWHLDAVDAFREIQDRKWIEASEREAVARAGKLSLPVIDPEELDPFAEAEEIVLTEPEVEALYPARTVPATTYPPMPIPIRQIHDFWHDTPMERHTIRFA